MKKKKCCCDARCHYKIRQSKKKKNLNRNINFFLTNLTIFNHEKNGKKCMITITKEEKNSFRKKR